MSDQSGEKPKIELYMYSLNQEFPASKGHQAYLKRSSELQRDITGELVLNASVETQVFSTEIPDVASPFEGWQSRQWVENHTKSVGLGTQQASNPLDGAVIREEDFGAILFEPQSDRVYKLNGPGARLVRAFRVSGHTGPGRPEKIEGFPEKIVDEFIDSLKAAGLWGMTR